MIKKYIFVFVSILLFCFPLMGIAQIDNETDWKLKKFKDGISIYTRTMEGSKFKEYKTVCEMNTTPEELLSILIDVERYTEWMAFVQEAEILELKGDSIFYVYSQVKVPWPFDNRDEITKSVVIKDTLTNIVRIDISLIYDYIPEKKGVVRLPEGRGVWVFTPLENGKTEVYHRFGADPGGKIPAWIVNMFLVDGPHKTILGLQDRVARTAQD